MEIFSILTKRWFGFFLLLFVVWFPVAFLLITMYNLLQHPLFLFVGNVFTPLWVFLVSYLYFRKTRNDWFARFVTAIGWMILFFVFSAITVKPVYGYEWTSVFTWQVINANWINFVAILMGGIATHKSEITRQTQKNTDT